jgi:hypothetical protein
MNTIEIKQRRKLVIPFIVAWVLLQLAGAWWIFFRDEYKNDIVAKGGFIAGVILFAYFTYLPVKKLLKNEPIITLTPDSIILNTSKVVVISKTDIKHIDVTMAEGNGYVLNIGTDVTSHEVGISWLDKTPAEIKALAERYMTG